MSTIVPSNSMFSGGKFGSLTKIPLISTAVIISIILLSFSIYSINAIDKCLPRLINEKNNEAVDSLNLDKKIVSFVTGLNIGILLINLTPNGLIRQRSLILFAILMVVVTIQSVYYFGRAQKSEEINNCPKKENQQSPMETLQPLIGLTWGYLGVGIGLLFGILFINGMALFSKSIQLRVLLGIGLVQLIIVNSFSLRTHNKCTEATSFKQEDEDFLNKFKKLQIPSIVIASLILLAVLVSFYFARM